MTPAHVEQIVVKLKGREMIKVGAGAADSAAERSQAGDDDRSGRAARSGTERSVGRCPDQRPYAFVVARDRAVDAESQGVHRGVTENVILFDDRALVTRRAAHQLGRETVRRAEASVVESIARCEAIAVRDVMVGADGEVILVGYLL